MKEDRVKGFAALAKLRDALPPAHPGGPAASASREGAAGVPPPRESGEAGAAGAPSRAVVRLERKGHAGKEVTVIERLEVRPDQLEDWLLDLKRALGCGGSVDGQALVLQGDQRARVRALLAARGVKRVSSG